MTLPFPLQTRARFHLVSKSVSHSFPTRFPLPSSRRETGNGVLGSTFSARTVHTDRLVHADVGQFPPDVGAAFEHRRCALAGFIHHVSESRYVHWMGLISGERRPPRSG
jgi:hypothetical protein